MKVKKVLVNEAKVHTGFVNKTEDQFPYIESTLNILDDNFNWWKKNWKELEELIAKILNKSLSDNMEDSNVSISSRFTVFHGEDDKIKDVVWTGPAIVYTFEGASSKVINTIRDILGGVYKGERDDIEYSRKSNLYKGHRMFVYENQLIILFG